MWTPTYSDAGDNATALPGLCPDTDDEFRFNDASTHVTHLCQNNILTLILLFTTTPTSANSVDPDQMASSEAI